jgi:hypothetical protein
MMVALSKPLVAAPIPTDSDCSEPHDYPELVRCVFAQKRCLPSYYGSEGTPDYPKALKCFETNRLWAFAALMYINGQGTTRDLPKAEAIVARWKQDGPDFNSDQAATLEKAIKKCKRHPDSCRRVDFCQDLARTTQETEFCVGAEQVAGERILGGAIAETRNNLSSANRALFDRVVAEFKAYQLDDMQRQYQASIDASLRDVEGAEQAAFVRDNFLKLMAETIESRKLKPVGLATYRSLSAQLDLVYERSIRRIVQSWQEDLRNPTFKDHWDEEKSYIKEYEESARESQAQWIKFRDSCAELATSLYRDRAGQFDPAVSMKAAVTKLRIAELRYNPIGPESN